MKVLNFNCSGSVSSTFNLIILVVKVVDVTTALPVTVTVTDCGGPLSANQVIIGPFNNTKFGSLITFHCEESNNSMTAECGSDGEWIPNPEQMECVNG